MDFLTLTSSSTLIIAFLSGIIPALIWLIFFTHEDIHPEPWQRIGLTFVVGMVTVLVALPIEAVIRNYIAGGSIGMMTIILWALTEEALKFGAAWVTALRTSIFDEPVDGLIYLITAALGFAALENTLFLLPSLGEGLYLNSIITGNLRFIGATLVHVGASGVLGAMIAFSFYRRKLIKEEYLVGGLIGATILHTVFNALLLRNNQIGLFTVFLGVWAIVIVVILLFERVKQPLPQPPVDSKHVE